MACFQAPISGDLNKHWVTLNAEDAGLKSKKRHSFTSLTCASDKVNDTAWPFGLKGKLMLISGELGN